RILITTTDSSFSGPREVRLDQISLTQAVLELPVAQGVPVGVTDGRDTESWLVAAALLALLLGVGGLAAYRRFRQSREPVRQEYADIPLVVDSLIKTYKDGHRAVDDVSWRAERGQVVGLRGPDGAGKTTTMRMMPGLVRPDSGGVHGLRRRRPPRADHPGQ